MFVERLQKIADRIGSAKAISLVAKDGIPVETFSTSSDIDLEMLAAELIAQVHAVTSNHQDLSPGLVRQLTISTEQMVLLVSIVTHEYYLLAVLEAGSNTGRARFELRRAVLDLEQDLL